MADAVQDNVDPRLLVAIAFVEGKWGGDADAGRTENSFGTHNAQGHLANFTSAGGWAASTAYAASVLQGMISGSFGSVNVLYGATPGSYCQGTGCPLKAGVVTAKLAALGGNPDSLTSPCYESNGAYYAKQQ
jgi:hypothetical protein